MSKERRAKGLYWDAAWKLVGCTKVSPGCGNCWSETETNTRAHHPHPDIHHRAQCVLNGNSFNGGIYLRHDNLDLPLRTKRPTVFAIWNDLYHEDVPDDFRDRAYAAMAMRPQHTFLVLTKRAERMAGYWSAPVFSLSQRLGDYSIVAATLFKKQQSFNNVFHGVTCENQQAADERIPHLLRVPGKRFLSIEPMLSEIDLSAYMGRSVVLPGDKVEPYNFGIDAVILGGESGKNARPMHPDWVRAVRNQCETSHVPFTFKQWGEYHPLVWFDGGDVCMGREEGYRTVDLDGSTMVRCGKKSAGRHLDGVLYDALPWDEVAK